MLALVQVLWRRSCGDEGACVVRVLTRLAAGAGARAGAGAGARARARARARAGAGAQDFMLPVGQVPAFVEALDRTMGLWPLWFCPLRNVPKPARSNPPPPPNLHTSASLERVSGRLKECGGGGAGGLVAVVATSRWRPPGRGGGGLR